MKKIEEQYDVAVVGGGVAGVIASIAAARYGCRTCLIHDRPVLGGNASSEIRVGIEGADYEFRHARETGILEEIRTEDRKRNYHRSINGATNYIFDTILLEWVRKEKNLVLHLNTCVFKAYSKGNAIEAVEGLQSGSENIYKVYSDIFIDASGDGVIAAESGAEFRMGREGKEEFNESIAPDKPDKHTQGTSLLFHVVDRGRIIKFAPPDWAYNFPLDEDIWEHNYGWGLRGPYVWVEAGGAETNTIHDNQKIMDELLKILYGVWDHMKNHGKHHAENLEIDWVGSIPGKRESRRIMGDYILTQGDLQKRELFEDRVVYGGWPLDVHNVGGFRAPKESGHSTIPLLSGLYSIPLRCYYSKNIDNLMMAGRNISVSHVALGSARIIASCAVGGQAVGAAASLCKKYGIMPRDIYKRHIEELQQMLLKDDCYLIGLKNEDKQDLALKAKVSGSSSMKLEVKGRGQKFELTQERAQIIFVTENRLDSIQLRLENRTDKKKNIELRIVRADMADRICGESTITDVGNIANVIREKGSFKYEKNILAKTETSLSAGEARWLKFKINAEIQPGAYWIILSKNEGIYWFGSDEIIPGLVAVYEIPGYGWSYMRRGILQFQLEPASFPFVPENVNNGISRPEYWPNIWISDPSRELPQYVEFDFGQPKEFDTVHLTFDTNLDRFLLTSGTYKECVSDYEILARCKGHWKSVVKVRDNYMRKRIHSFSRIKADALRLVIHRTNGVSEARIYEIRVYNEKIGKKK